MRGVRLIDLRIADTFGCPLSNSLTGERVYIREDTLSHQTVATLSDWAGMGVLIASFSAVGCTVINVTGDLVLCLIAQFVTEKVGRVLRL